MTGPSVSVPVSVQWALHGKSPDGERYRVLACSNGGLNEANFEDAIGRFLLGAPDIMPQVSVSYLQPAASQSGGSYLALAIHWYAADGQHYAAGAAPRDEHGRRTAFTSYFCTPYRPLAEHAVTYQDMYRAFSKVTLAASDGPPQPVTIQTPAAKTPAIDGLAMRVAPLLLTGTPVCVRDAEEATLEERLRFVDTVMALLPYGFRARMTAATWTKPTYQNHRFRLYFSSAPRTDQQDHVVSWGQQPDEVSLRGQAQDYFDWLADKVNPLTGLGSLSELSTDLRFDSTALTKALELAYSLQGRRRAWTLSPYSQQSSRPLGEAAGPQAASTAEIAEVLRECAGYVDRRNPARLRATASWLAKQAKSDSLVKQRAAADSNLTAEAEAVDRRREQYRGLVKEYGLLRPHPALGTRGKDLYAALLEVAFGRPLSYPAYCQVEDCLDAEPGEHPHPALLNAIKDGETDSKTSAVVRYLACHGARSEEPASRGAKELNRWYASGEVDPSALVNWLGQDWDRPHHARVVCDLTIDFLLKAQRFYEADKVRKALRQHGFLARALHLLHPGKEQYQVYALHCLLSAAFPGGLDRIAIGYILTGTRYPPTPALLATVMLFLSAEADAENIRFAQDAYVHGSLTLMTLHPDTYGSLRGNIPALNAPRLAGKDDQTEDILLSCVRQAQARDLEALRDSITALRVYAVVAPNRKRYRQIVVEHQLMSADLRLGELTDDFYDMLVKLAFGTPLGYSGFCQLVDCLPPTDATEPRPGDVLLRAIERAANTGLNGGRPDIRVVAIVTAYLNEARAEPRHRHSRPDAARGNDAKPRAGQLDAVRLIGALAEPWDRPQHASLALNVLARYLTTLATLERPEVRRALQAHGHLALALQSIWPDSPDEQISALEQLLNAAYPGKLDEPTVWAILAPEAQTEALLMAVSGKTNNPRVKSQILKLFGNSARQRSGASGAPT